MPPRRGLRFVRHPPQAIRGRYSRYPGSDVTLRGQRDGEREIASSVDATSAVAARQRTTLSGVSARFAPPTGGWLGKMAWARKTNYSTLLNWYSRRTAFERPGSRDLRFAHFAAAREAPAPHAVYADLDGRGWLWTDEDVSELLGHLTRHAAGRKEYWEEALPLMREIEGWAGGTVGRRSLRELGRGYAAAGLQEDTARVLARLAALQGGELQPEDELAVAEGCGAAGDAAGAAAAGQRLRDRGHATPAAATLGPLLRALARRGDAAALRELLPAARQAGPPGEVLHRCVAACLDAGDGVAAMGFAALATEQGASLAPARGPGKVDADDLRRRLCESVQRAADAETALGLLRVWMRGDLGEVPGPAAGWEAAYDALIVRAAGLGLPQVAAAVFREVEHFNALSQQTRNREQRMVSPNACNHLLSAASQSSPFDAELAVSVLMHMRRFVQQPGFATLLHLQMVVEGSWASAPAVAAAALEVCPNLDDRLLYYMPGWQSVRLRRSPCATQQALARLMRGASRLYIPAPSWMAERSEQLPGALRGMDVGELLLLGGSALSALQVRGDELREKGTPAAQADAPLRAVAALLGEAQGVRGGPDPAQLGAPVPLEVVGPVEQRLLSVAVAADASAAEPAPGSDTDKLALFACAAARAGAPQRAQVTVLVPPGDPQVQRIQEVCSAAGAETRVVVGDTIK
eukprot:TRINITY_DN40523_c0_g1_i1.p1 TRINITY_DN40523_c0_g1~~TRINITY_DN40523_c0_g1_i1.p1  ORF type:complete len:725 (+),score=203.23 TRINITY_DN40523_c0_g1_i1:98-2176(+)